MRLAGAIFDLDGTLADTLPACFAAFRTACAKLGGPAYTDAQIRGLFGPSEEGMVQRTSRSVLGSFHPSRPRWRDSASAGSRWRW